MSAWAQWHRLSVLWGAPGLAVDRMSEAFGDWGATAPNAGSSGAIGILPSRDLDALLRALPADARSGYEKYCSRVQKALARRESVHVLALATSGGPGVLALTDRR